MCNHYNQHHQRENSIEILYYLTNKPFPNEGHVVDSIGMNLWPQFPLCWCLYTSILQGCIFSHALIQPLGAFPHSYRLTKTYISLSLGHDLEPSWFSKGGIQGKNIYYTAQMYTISFVQDIHKLLMWRNFILGTAYPNSLYVHFMTRSLLSLRLH